MTAGEIQPGQCLCGRQGNSRIQVTDEGLHEFVSDYIPASRRALFYRARAVIYADVAAGIRIMHCERCGFEKYLQVHHKDRDINNNRTDNLEILCRKCHQEEHPELLERLYPGEAEEYPVTAQEPTEASV